MSTRALAAVLCLGLAVSVAGDVVKPKKLICGMNQFSWGLYIPFAVKYYSKHYPAIDWQYEPSTLTKGAGWSDLTETMRWWVVDGEKCDAFIGTAWSDSAITLSALVTSKVAWLDPGSTSNRLSDKDAYPHFSRVIVADSDHALFPYTVCKSMGWKRVSVIAVDSSYGVSYRQSFIHYWHSSDEGRRVDVARFIPSKPTAEEFKSVVEALVQSLTRVVVVVGLDPEITPGLIKELRNRKVYDSFTLFLPENHCASESFDAPGAMCATTTIRTDTPFLTAFQNQSTSDADEVKSRLIAKGMVTQDWMDGFPSKPDWGPFSANAHDATLHAMHAIDSYEKLANKTGVSLAQYTRNVSIEGATGRTSLNKATGNRVDFLATVSNLDAKGVVRKVATMSLSDSIITFSKPLYLRGASYVPGAAYPADGITAKKDRTIVFVLLGAGAMILVIVTLAVIAIACIYSRGQRATRDAPKDMTKPFAMVFTDIQASTALWARHPEFMGEALDVHNRIIRDQLHLFRGYEVKTIGDSFMVAFKDPANAVQFAMTCQSLLNDQDWGAASQDLDATVSELVATKYPEWYADNNTVPVGKVLFNGLRVRMGIHFGLGNSKVDAETGAYDYFGTLVNTAARIEAVCHGGQVCITDAALQGARECGWDEADNNLKSTDLGPQPLRGLDAAVRLHQVLPKVIADRQFPPLRLEMDIADIEIDDSESADDDTRPGNSTTTSKAVAKSARDSHATAESGGGSTESSATDANPVMELARRVANAQFARRKSYIACGTRSSKFDAISSRGFRGSGGDHPSATRGNTTVGANHGPFVQRGSALAAADTAQLPRGGSEGMPGVVTEGTSAGEQTGSPRDASAAGGSERLATGERGAAGESGSGASYGAPAVLVDAVTDRSVHSGAESGRLFKASVADAAMAEGVPVSASPLLAGNAESVLLMHQAIKALLAPARPIDRRAALKAMAANWRLPNRGPGGDNWKAVRRVRRRVDNEDFVSVLLAAKVIATLQAIQKTSTREPNTLSAVPSGL